MKGLARRPDYVDGDKQTNHTMTVFRDTVARETKHRQQENNVAKSRQVLRASVTQVQIPHSPSVFLKPTPFEKGGALVLLQTVFRTGGLRL